MYATSYLEQIPETTPHDTTTIRPLTSHHKNHPNKTQKTCKTLMERPDEFISDVHFGLHFVKVTYLGIRSAHERVWLVERKPIWLPRAYLTRGDLEPARGNLHVCKFLRDLMNIQIRTVTAERVGFVLSEFARRTCYNAKKEGRKEGRRELEGERERRKEGERGRKRERRNS